MGINSSFMIILLYLYLLSFKHYAQCIIGGWRAAKEKWGYLVPIAYEMRYHCVGSIIMPSWILTAARCVHKSHVGMANPIGILVHITVYEKDKGVLVRMEDYFVHPYFMSDPHSGASVNDIAIIKLEQFIVYGRGTYPSGIGLEMLGDGTRCMAAGWGAANPEIYRDRNVHNPEFFDKPNRLKDIQMETIRLDFCKDLMPPSKKDSLDIDFHVCARDLTFYSKPWGQVRRYKRKTNITKRSIISDLVNKDKAINSIYRGTTLRYRRYHWHDYNAIADWIGYNDYSSRGPSYGDEGGPITTNGEQLGVFTFPLHNLNIHLPQAAAVYTRIDRNMEWMDNIIRREMSKITNSSSYLTNPPFSDIWDELSSANLITVNHFTILCILIFFVLL